ncbi:hypothetical protein MP638_000373 [Amoeboaphelidium occidentale]|nr:hypothetical protein MP638_000373 [Amoeboaphelidium occidentale]
MNLLVIGSGGREHAIAWKLAQSETVSHVYVSPGNAGTGSARNQKISNLDLGNGVDNAKISAFCKENNVELVVVGPEQPLVDGLVDYLKKDGIACFGPSKAASKLEGSKAFSKDFMKRHNIPTAQYEVFTDFEKAKKYVNDVSFKVVIKASGLAAGKGVLIPENKQEAIDALVQILVKKLFGDAGDEVVVEEFLEGEECSILAFSDGYTVVPLLPSQDHKRIFDGDKGPNTGGMGAYCPTPVVSAKQMEVIKKDILQKTIDGMRREGTPFVGVLFAGIMVTSSGPKTLEFNVRMGDPETQVVLPLLSDSTDLAKIMLACCGGYLDSVPITFKKGFCATVVAASEGYPGSYPKGKIISLGQDTKDSLVFHAGTKTNNDGNVETSGGRVLCSVGISEKDLKSALSAAYTRLESINFEGMQFRKDIGHRALNPKGTVSSATYADAGVSIDRGNKLVDRIKAFTKKTKRPGSDAAIGGFGGLFELKAAGYEKDAILVGATDGVGTKLKIAHIMNKHDTIGIDLVGMNVNDLIVQGAEPLFFLDYYACGKLDVDVASDVVKGIAAGCEDARCALIGGETAEMPGMYQGGDYDLAGFTVGAVKRELMLPLVNEIRPGDIVLGLASSGVHSNGYSLARHVIASNNLDYHSPCPFEPSKSIGDILLTPTRIYIRQLLPVVQARAVKGMAHITGGGLLENIPRVLPDNVGVTLDAKSWPLLPVFKWLKKLGNISAFEMSRTFNCGIGMMLVVAPEQVEQVKSLLEASKEAVYTIGKIVPIEEARTGEHIVKVENTEIAWA